MLGLPLAPGRSVAVSAPAKINLTLEILGRRPDGYHDIASVMQTVSLADRLTLSPADGVILDCDAEGLNSPDNLVIKAAHLLREERGVEAGVRIRLGKKIPVARGLGGGSSDAAAILRGLNVLWNLGLSLAELLPMASGLGSDVPFFLVGGTVLVEGRGEKLTPLPTLRKRWLVLAAPDHDLAGKTGVMYRSLRPGDFSDGSAARRLAAALGEGQNIEPSLLLNGFEAVAFRVFPGLAELRATFQEVCGGPVWLSGAGPALYALVDGRETAGRAASELAKRGVRAWAASTTGPAPEIRAGG